MTCPLSYKSLCERLPTFIKSCGALFAFFCLVSETQASGCVIKANGKPKTEILACDITDKGGVKTIEQGNVFTAQIRKGILYSNINRPGGPKADLYKLDSFGKVRIEPTEEGECYNTSKLKICVIPDLNP